MKFGHFKFLGAAALLAFPGSLAADGPDVHSLVLSGHTDALNDVNFSPDGNRVVTASEDKTARIWDSSTGKLLFTLEGHSRSVDSAAFIADGQKVLTTSRDKTARIWDSSSGKSLHELRAPAGLAALSCSLSHDGKRVALLADGPARIWATGDGKELFSITGHGNEILSLAFTPDDARILTTENDRIYFWDVANGKELSSITRQGGDPSIIESINWTESSPDGNRIVIPLGDGTCVLDAKSGKVLRSLRGHKAPVSSAVFSPSGKSLVTASRMKSVMFLPSGEKIENHDFAIYVWDSSSGKEVFHADGYKASVGSTSFSPNGERLLTCGDARADIWDAKTGKKIISLTGHAGSVEAAAFSPDAKRVATSSQDKTARIWSLPSTK
jgi:WD40 repeat protein